jgi:hypothetical protein
LDPCIDEEQTDRYRFNALTNKGYMKDLPMRTSTFLITVISVFLGSCDNGINSHCVNLGCEQVGDEYGEEGEDTDSEAPILTDNYVAGLQKTTLNGHFTVTLVESTPIPKDIDKYDWRLTITDSSGQPIGNAEVAAEPMMPAHGHGTQPPVTSGEMSEDNAYLLSQMYLYMPGVWEVTIRIKSEEGLEDEVSYLFELDG